MNTLPIDTNMLDFYTSDRTTEQQIINFPEVKPIDSIRNVILDIKKQTDFKKQKILIAFDIDGTILFTCLQNTVDGLMIEKMKIENNITDIINNISKYADVICLTARAIEESPKLQLTKYGFTLENKHNKIIFSNMQKQLFKNCGANYTQNIIYASYLEKGRALKMFYDISNVKYDKVFFVDDIIENCDSVNVVLTSNNIAVQTYHIDADIGYLSTNITDKYATLIENATIKQQAYFHDK